MSCSRLLAKSDIVRRVVGKRYVFEAHLKYIPIQSRASLSAIPTGNQVVLITYGGHPHTVNMKVDVHTFRTNKDCLDFIQRVEDGYCTKCGNVASCPF